MNKSELPVGDNRSIPWCDDELLYWRGVPLVYGTRRTESGPRIDRVALPGRRVVPLDTLPGAQHPQRLREGPL